MNALRSLLVLVAVGTSVASVACTIGEERFEVVKYPKLKKASATFTCDSPIVTPDLSKQKACGEGRGKGHCYDKKRVPVPADQLIPCDGDEICIPDKVLKAGGKKLKSCTFTVPGMPQKPGACASLIFKQLFDFKDMLGKDVCDEDERCGPCVDPTSGKDTGLCEEKVGVHEKDCTEGAAANDQKQCCHGMGLCMPKENAPPDARDHMSQDSCPNDSQVCIPADQTSGKVTKCEVLGMDGVCMDLCFASMFSTTAPVTRSSCGPTQLCMPCLLGKGQGMLGCD